MGLDSVACWRHLTAHCIAFSTKTWDFQVHRCAASANFRFCSWHFDSCHTCSGVMPLCYFSILQKVEVKTPDLWLPSWSLIAVLQLYRWDQHWFWRYFLWALLNCLSWARIKFTVCMAKSGVEKSCSVSLEGILQCIFWNTRVVAMC